jgi:hypothetical protein
VGHKLSVKRIAIVEGQLTAGHPQTKELLFRSELKNDHQSDQIKPAKLPTGKATV